MSSNSYWDGKDYTLIDISEHLKKEIWALSDMVSEIGDRTLTKEEFKDYQKQFNWVQKLFDDASVIIKDIDKTQANPNLYNDLSAERQISISFDKFSRVQNSFINRYKERDERELEFEHSLDFPGMGAPGEVDNDWLESHENNLDMKAENDIDGFYQFLAQMEEEAAEKEKKEKAKKLKDRQKRAQEEARRAEEEALRENESSTQNKDVYDSNRDTQNESFSVIDDRVYDAEQERMERMRLEKQIQDEKASHERFLEEEQSFSTRQQAEIYQAEQKRLYEEQVHAQEANGSYDDGYKESQRLYEEQRLREREQYTQRQFEEQNRITQTDFDSSRGSNPYVPDASFYEQNQPQTHDDAFSQGMQYETERYQEDYRRYQEEQYQAEQRRQFDEQSRSTESPFSYSEQYQEQQRQDRDRQFREQDESMRRNYEEQKRFQSFDSDSFKDSGPSTTELQLNPYQAHDDAQKRYMEEESQRREAEFNLNKSDNEWLYNRLYQENDAKAADTPLYVSNDYNTLFKENVETAREDYLSSRGTADEMARREYYDRQALQYERYQNAVEQGKIEINDSNAVDRSWFAPVYTEQFRNEPPVSDFSSGNYSLDEIKPQESYRPQEEKSYSEFSRYSEQNQYQDNYRYEEPVIPPEYKRDNEYLYNRLYEDRDSAPSSESPVYISSDYNTLFEQNVESAKNEYLSKVGTADEMSAMEYYNRQSLQYERYQNALEQGKIEINDSYAIDKEWNIPVTPIPSKIDEYTEQNIPIKPFETQKFDSEAFRPQEPSFNTYDDKSFSDTNIFKDVHPEYKKDNEWLYNRLYQDIDARPNETTIFVSSDFNDILKENVENAKHDYLESRGTQNEMAAKEFYDRQMLQYERYQNAVDNGNIHVNDLYAADKLWFLNNETQVSQKESPQTHSFDTESFSNQHKTDDVKTAFDDTNYDVSQSINSTDNAWLYNRLYQDIGSNKDDVTVFVSSDFHNLVKTNVDSAKEDYFSKKGTADEDSARAFYEKQQHIYDNYHAALDNGKIYVNDMYAADKNWLDVKDFSSKESNHIHTVLDNHGYQGEYLRYVPGGVARQAIYNYMTAPDSLDNIAIDNTKILSLINDNKADTHTVSQNVETLMRYNLETAKQDYLDKKGTADEYQAGLHYYEQRSSWWQFQEQVRTGEIQVNRHEDFAKIENSPFYMKTNNAPFQDGTFVMRSYVPGGVASKVIMDNKVVGTFVSNTSKERNNVVYTKDNPLYVTPEYDKAMANNVSRAMLSSNIWLNQSANDAQFMHHATTIKAMDLKLATDANSEYIKAKKEGRVIVTDDSDLIAPDFAYWQNAKFAREAGLDIKNFGKGNSGGEVKSSADSKDKKTPLGETLHSKRVFETSKGQAQSAAVDNINNGLFGNKNHLKYHKDKKPGTGAAAGASLYVTRKLQQKVYSIAQSEESGAVGEAETFRQYTLPARQMAVAQAKSMFYNSKVIGTKGTLDEWSLFGKRADLSDADLLGSIKSAKETRSALKNEIKSLTQDAKTLKGKIKALEAKGEFLIGVEQKKLSMLKAEHKSVNKKLGRLHAEDFKVNQALKKDLKQLKFRENLADQLEIVEKLEANKIFGVKSQRVLRDMRMNTIMDHNMKMRKKYGKLAAATPKSLQKEIDARLKDAKAIKGKIKALEAKGSLLSAGERKELLALKKTHDELNKKLKQLFGLKSANDKLAVTLGNLDGASKIVGKRMQAAKQGAFTLNSVFMRMLRESDDAGLLGVAKAAELSSNYYVRAVAKKTIITTLKTARFMVRATGIPQAAKWVGNKAMNTQTGQAVRRVAKMPGNAAKTGIKHAVRTRDKIKKKTVEFIKRHTPNPIKTGIIKTKAGVAKATGTVKAAWGSAKTAILSSKFAQPFLIANNIVNKVAGAVKTGIALTMSFLKYLLLGFLGIFGICSIAVILFAMGFGLANTMVMDDPANIKDYTQLCQGWKTQFDKDVENEVDDHRIYVKGEQVNNVQIVYINGNADNTKEIISMAAVYLSQDFSDRDRAKKYMEGLHDDSHSYNVVATDLSYCAGCYCPGHKYCDGHSYCTGHYWSDVLEDGTVIGGSYSCGGCQTSYCSGCKIKYCDGCECDGHQNYDVNVIIHTFDTIFEHDSQANVGRDLVADKDGYMGTFKITAYCGCEACCGKTDGITASGTQATEGRTIAVDPNVIPYGTTVWINGKPYVAEDKGGAIDGKEIDMYFKSHKKALAWGVKTYPVYKSKVNNAADDGKDYTFDGWHEDNRDWAKRIFEQDWKELYDIDFIAGGVLTPDFDAFFIPEDEAKGLTQDQLKMVDVATHSGSRGIPAQAGYCQKWVKLVYQKAIGKTSAGAASANVAGRQWAISADWSKIPVGAAVYGYGRTPSSNPYGHVGIYIGNGTVLHNVGGVASDTLTEWVSKYHGYGWGWQNGDSLQD